MLGIMSESDVKAMVSQEAWASWPSCPGEFTEKIPTGPEVLRPALDRVAPHWRPGPSRLAELVVHLLNIPRRPTKSLDGLLA